MPVCLFSFKSKQNKLLASLQVASHKRKQQQCHREAGSEACMTTSSSLPAIEDKLFSG